jgi:hypothetical protein
VIVHVVLFKPDAALTTDARMALVEAFAEAARSIPSVARARVGRRVLAGRPYEAQMTVDYEYAALLEFEDLDAVRAYLDHPAHGTLAQRFFASVETAIMYDFDLRDAAQGLDDLVRP